jgi:hypothetical protein
MTTPKQKKALKIYFINFLILFFAITLSLSIFKLNEKWSNNKSEKELMRNLLEDLNADLANLQTIIAYDSMRIVDLDGLIAMRNANFKLAATKKMFYDKVFYCFSNTSHYVSHNGSMIQLNNKGGYSLIRNRALVDSLIDFESGKALIDEQEEFYKHTLLKIYDLKYDLMDETIYDDKFSFNKENNTFAEKANPYIETDTRKLIKFFNLARDYKKETRFYYKNMLKNHLRLTNNIVQMIKKEYSF